MKQRLKAAGIDKEAEDLAKSSGLMNMAICSNSKEALLVYPEKLDAPWIAVVARFMLLSYVDKRSGKHEKLGTGIAKVGRFKTATDCRKALANASAELTPILKPDEQKALICLATTQG